MRKPQGQVEVNVPKAGTTPSGTTGNDWERLVICAGRSVPTLGNDKERDPFPNPCPYRARFGAIVLKLERKGGAAHGG